MRVYVQLRNVFKEFEIGLEFALNDAELGQYKHLKKEYEELVEKHGKAMEVYLKMVKEFKEGKRDKMPENHPGNGPTFEEYFKPKYERMKMDWNRRWHSIELEGKMETNMVELIEKAQKWFEPKIGVPQFVAGKYRAFREEKDEKDKVKIVEIWPNNVIGNNDKIFFEFIR